MSPEDDLLSSVLSAYHLRAGVYGCPRFCGAWQHGTAGMHRGAFHLIGTGGAWFHTRQQAAPIRLEPGDLVVLPHDAWHMLSAGPVLHGEDSIPIQEGEGPYTVVVCGFFEFELGDKNPILDALPEVLVVTHREGGRALATLNQQIHVTLAEVAKLYNSVIQGWWNYCGAFYTTSVYKIFRHIDFAL